MTIRSPIRSGAYGLAMLVRPVAEAVDRWGPLGIRECSQRGQGVAGHVDRPEGLDQAGAADELPLLHVAVRIRAVDAAQLVVVSLEALVADGAVGGLRFRLADLAAARCLQHTGSSSSCLLHTIARLVC